MDIEAGLELHEIMVCGEHAVLITTHSNLRNVSLSLLYIACKFNDRG